MNGTTVDLLAVQLERGLDGLLRVERHVREATRLAGVAVHLHARRDDLSALSELLGKPVVVDVPGEATYEDGVGLACFGGIGFSLLGGSLSRLFSLAFTCCGVLAASIK